MGSCPAQLVIPGLEAVHIRGTGKLLLPSRGLRFQAEPREECLEGLSGLVERAATGGGEWRPFPQGALTAPPS